jgi:hypothetical protein
MHFDAFWTKTGNGARRIVCPLIEEGVLEDLRSFLG